MNHRLPFGLHDIRAMAERFPTPFYLYDEAGIRRQARRLQQTMDAAGVPGFRNFFAAKALPNPAILSILHEEGMGLDCSSLAELQLAERLGVSGTDIIFTSNNTTMSEFAAAQQMGAIINFDDITLVQPFLKDLGLPTVACCRYNPGDMAFPGGDPAHYSGSPSQMKYGMPKDQIMQAYRQLQAAGVQRFGLHSMIFGNEMDYRNYLHFASEVFGLAHELHRKLGITFEFINLGGGIGVPYSPGQKPFNYRSYAEGIVKLYRQHDLGVIGAPRIVMESGRLVTAESGYLIAKVINQKNTHKRYIGLDASMANLMRPGMYGAYHHITVLGKENQPANETVDIVGSICENNDKFAIDRRLPVVEIGDLVAIHTVGAHGHTMGYNYNGKLRSAELLLEPNGGVRLIRRAETLEDLFATLDLNVQPIRSNHDRIHLLR